MPTKLHNLKPAGGSRKAKKRVGRGNASKHGTYSTRGMKGQKSRSGGKGGLKMRGFRAEFMSIPKLRGFKSIKPKMKSVNISDLNGKFKDGDAVTPQTLVKAGLIRDARTGIKILGLGKLEKKLTVGGCFLSKSAEKAIAKAGGKAEGVAKKEVSAKPAKSKTGDKGIEKVADKKEKPAEKEAKKKPEPRKKAKKEKK